MHRLIGRSAVLPLLPLAAWLALGLGLGCGNKKPADNATSTSDGGEDGGAGGDESASGGADGGPGEKKDECVGFDIGNVEDLLLKNACEEPNVKPDSIQPVDLKGKLEVSVSASPTRSAGGGKVDLLVAFVNKSKEPLVLHFKIDPVPRFEIEVYDTKKSKRADVPTGPTPPPPKGATQPPPSEAKSARITIAPNGSARARMPWEAVKMKWAPEKYRGTPPERGYPRAAAGPLPKGKYLVKVLTPLVGVSEGVDHEMTAPKVEIEVEK
ncbi:MAG: hypothetical protein JWO86_1858 [Myxococcaceae bacterium]|jgi:hypothetical protein|nr:hypothetical protein [Myxococcaceae bacterium]MEA2750438.1 hypothetical protein [Myxococcales bacterium]